MKRTKPVASLKNRLLAAWSALSLALPPTLAQAVVERPAPLLIPPPAVRGHLHAGTLKHARHLRLSPSLKEAHAYQRTFRVLLANPERTDRYDEFILLYAQAHGLDPRLVKAIIAAESQFDPKARSPRGARGLMQLMPATGEEMGTPRKELHDPEGNIRAGAAYLERLFRAPWKHSKLQGVAYTDAPLWLVRRVIAAYNAGPKALRRGARWQPQTVEYVNKVLLFYRSSVTDIRRPAAPAQSQPDLALLLPY